MADDEPQELEDISGVGPSKAEALREAGYESVEDVKAASQAELSEVDGIGNALAARIKADVGGLEVTEETEAEVEETEPVEEEPEEDVDDSGGDSGDGDGELADAIDATLRYCTEGEDDPDGDVISSGSLSNVLSGLGIGVPLDGNRNSDSAERAPFPAQSQSSSTADTCVCLEWNVPTSVGNEIQTDSVGFDLSFIAEQSRHSDGIDIGSGLSGYYPLDTVQDGVADDVSGNDNDGSIEGDVSPVAGQIANAGSFDGDSGAVTTDVNVGGSNESVSLSGWLKAPSQTLNQTHFFLSNYLDRPGGGGKHGGFFAIGSNDGDTMYFWTRDQESDISTRTGSYGPAFDEEWHHYAGVRDAEAEEIRFYIDGEKKESTSFPGDVAIRDSDSFFGMMKHFDTRYLEGNVDDVLIYDRALSDAEVKTIYDDSA